MGPREIVIIALVVVLLFGAPKLPQLARSIGKSMRILKDETRSLSDDDKSRGASNGARDEEQAVDDGIADNRGPDHRGFDRPNADNKGSGDDGRAHS